MFPFSSCFLLSSLWPEVGDGGWGEAAEALSAWGKGGAGGQQPPCPWAGGVPGQALSGDQGRAVAVASSDCQHLPLDWASGMAASWALGLRGLLGWLQASDLLCVSRYTDLV